MGLTSPALIALLAVLSGLLMAGAVGYWHKLARPGLIWFAGRIAVVGVLDVVVLGLILAIANQSGGFYASWSELFGTEHVSGHIIAVGRDPVAARTLHGHDGQLTVTSRLAIAVPGHPRIRGGRLLTVTMTGPVSGITASGYVYAPAAAPRMTTRPDLPAIVIISDWLGATGAAFSARRIARTAAAEIASGRLRRTLIVMLPATIAPGAGRTCLDVPGGPQAATFFAQDLPYLLRHQPMQPVSVLLTGSYLAASPMLALARAPLRIDSLAGGALPLASVLDEIGHLLGTQP